MESSGGDSAASAAASPARDLADINPDDYSRWNTGIGELDRVLGGGIVPGSVVLLGGEPGIGKSTLLLQWADARDGAAGPVVYVNGEESGAQIARRADRIGVSSDNIKLISPGCIEQLVDDLEDLQPSLVFIDSIQTITSEDSSGMPGSVAQLRTATQKIVKAAKKFAVPFVLVGHVTKSGDIGGPKRLEHMVDTVLYFDEANRGHRFIRSAKNRFGATGELGIFEMTGKGLRSISNPGQYFRGSDEEECGCLATISLQGNRPLLVEVQALVTPSQYGTPQRSATGFSNQRLHMLLAVLEKKMGLPLGTQDVFVNVAGGLQLDDPGADLAMAMAILSSFKEKSLRPGIAFGELGLTGELRPPAQVDSRVREAIRLDNSPLVVGGEDIRQNEHSSQYKTVNSIARAADLLIK